MVEKSLQVCLGKPLELLVQHQRLIFVERGGVTHQSLHHLLPGSDCELACVRLRLQTRHPLDRLRARSRVGL